MKDASSRYTERHRTKVGGAASLSDEHEESILSVLRTSAEILAENDRAAVKEALRGATSRTVQARILPLIDKVTTLDDEGNAARSISAESYANTMATTVLHTASNQVLKNAYAENNVEWVMWVCEADPCPLCEPGDGQVFRLGTDCPGVGFDSPPVHPNCRCILVGADAPT